MASNIRVYASNIRVSTWPLTCGDVTDLAHKPILAVEWITIRGVDRLIISPHQAIVMVQPRGQTENISLQTYFSHIYQTFLGMTTLMGWPSLSAHSNKISSV